MARYIEIDKAIPLMIQACADIVGHGITQVDAVRIAEILEDASTLDVEVKKHGEWMSTCDSHPLVNKYKCSCCGKESMRGNYCPECGAKMKGGAE